MEKVADKSILLEIENKNYSKKSKKEIETAINNDNFMDSEEAKKFGLIDNIIFHQKG